MRRPPPDVLEALARAFHVRPESVYVSDLAPPNGAIVGDFTRAFPRTYAPPVTAVHPRDVSLYRWLHGGMVGPQPGPDPLPSDVTAPPVASATTPVLHAHVMAAAAKACGRKPPWRATVAPPRTVPSAHFTVDPDGRVWDHTPYLTGHRDAHTPPNRNTYGAHL